jgi:hypothetical protein
VLDDVGQHDDVEAARILEVLEGHFADVEAEALAGMGRRRLRELQADDLAAAPARLIEQQAVAAPDVEQACARAQAEEIEELRARLRRGAEARATTRSSAMRWRTWAARGPSPGTRSMTSMTRWYRSRSFSITMSNGVVVVPSSL